MSLKLKPIVQQQKQIKFAFTMKQGTAEGLARYQDMYARAYGSQISTRDLIEGIVTAFLAEDKAFQKNAAAAGTGIGTGPV